MAVSSVSLGCTLLETMNVGDEYYEVTFTTPLDDREVVRIARVLDVDLAGVCKVVVSFVRNPLDTQVLRNKMTTTRRLLDGNIGDQQYECFDVDHNG